MMALFFCHFSHTIHKIQCLPKIGEGEGAGDMVFVHDLPVGPFGHLTVKIGKFLAL